MPAVARQVTNLSEGAGMRHWGVAGGGVWDDYLSFSQKLLEILDRKNTAIKIVVHFLIKAGNESNFQYFN